MGVVLFDLQESNLSQGTYSSKGGAKKSTTQGGIVKNTRQVSDRLRASIKKNTPQESDRLRGGTKKSPGLFPVYWGVFIW